MTVYLHSFITNQTYFYFWKKDSWNCSSNFFWQIFVFQIMLPVGALYCTILEWFLSTNWFLLLNLLFNGYHLSRAFDFAEQDTSVCAIAQLFHLLIPIHTDDEFIQMFLTVKVCTFTAQLLIQFQNDYDWWWVLDMKILIKVWYSHKLKIVSILLWIGFSLRRILVVQTAWL